MSFVPIPLRWVETLDAIWPDDDDDSSMSKPSTTAQRGDAKWVSSGGPHVTGKNGEAIPLKEHAALAFSCPGCGSYGAITVGLEKDPSSKHQWEWDGNIEAPTLWPSIHCVGCCKWHGYLVKGIFQLDAPPPRHK